MPYDAPSVDKIRAPYGFVPLNRAVVLPEWGTVVSQDFPLEDGIRGALNIEVESHSPIFTRGVSQAKDEFFRAPSGVYGIPGSSIRGMLRNVVEIASFGRMNRVQNRRYGVRDLHNRDVYGNHMAAVMKTPHGKTEPMPLVNAGWLTLHADGDGGATATIEPCHFAKVDYALVIHLAGLAGVSRFDPGTKQSAVDKYRQWGEGRSRQAALKVQALRINQGRRLMSEYGKALGVGQTQGTLVFTGQPSRYDPNRVKRRGSGNPKHHDFFFYGKAGNATIEVNESQLQDFEFIHSDGGEQHRLTGRLTPNAEWGHWRRRAEKGEKVPVFFLLNEDGSLRAFGLAMMFRLAYAQTTLDLVRRGQTDRAPERPDFAQALFGHVPLRGGHDEVGMLKGRINVGFASLIGSANVLPPVTVVLGTPKASYYPNYIEQNPSRGHGQRPTPSGNTFRWKTYMDADATVRGYKRYRPIRGHGVLRADPPTPKVATTFRPLAAGSRFTLTLRVHNVKPEEMGALLWALDFGGASDTFHKLGMARPLGYGSVTLRRGEHRLRLNSGPATLTDDDLAKCVKAFEDYMDAQVPGWKQTPQIRELIALARPAPPEDLRHMSIAHPAFGNEFAGAKKGGLALAAVTGSGGGGPGPSRDRDPKLLGPHSRGGGPAPRQPDRGAYSNGPTTGSGGTSHGSSTPAVGKPAKARLTEQNKKGKWRFEILDSDIKGTVINGQAPEGVAVGSIVEVVLFRIASRSAAEANWP